MAINRTTQGLLIWVCLLASASAADNEALRDSTGQLHLSQAVICESLDNFKPLNPSAVFSVQTGSVMCFTAFDRVPRQTSIFHDWIRQDKLIFRKKLVLKTPSWSSVSSIQLREADKGPWRVEIRDIDGNLLRTLRFSITD
jgi:hypothetical protein